MTDNVIILTGGLTGSSVVGGMLSAAGYWTGPGTFKKPDYNTHENEELIALNRQLMARVGVGEEYTKYFLPEAVDAIQSLDSTDCVQFEAFINRCDQHSPWVWKEPRLWLTIRYWERFLPKAGVRFLLLERDLLQAWVSMTQRRTIQSWDYTKRYNAGVQKSLRDYLQASGRPFIALKYESLICNPEHEVERLSAFLGTTITLDHLRSTYKGALYQKNKGPVDFIEAALIYIKNYGMRLR